MQPDEFKTYYKHPLDQLDDHAKDGVITCVNGYLYEKNHSAAGGGGSKQPSPVTKVGLFSPGKSEQRWTDLVRRLTDRADKEGDPMLIDKIRKAVNSEDDDQCVAAFNAVLSSDSSLKHVLMKLLEGDEFNDLEFESTDVSP